MAGTVSAQVNAAVTGALAPAARYAALVVQTNPHGTADQLLARPDVSAQLSDALEEAGQAASALVEQEWGAAGGPDSPQLAHLLADIGRQYGNRDGLLRAVRAAYASVPPAQFVPGVTPPGHHPSGEAAASRASAVRDAILGFARDCATRTKMTIAVAATFARAASVLADGYARRAAGEHVLKRWECRKDGKACFWCRRLNGVTIGLDESFLPYLGGPADLTGHGRLTQPPRPYRGVLQHPGLHPHCRCKIVIVAGAAHTARTQASTSANRKTRPAETPGTVRSATSAIVAPEAVPVPVYITAAQIRAMPEARYQGLLSFLRAAVHELGQVLSRLRGVLTR